MLVSYGTLQLVCTEILLALPVNPTLPEILLPKHCVASSLLCFKFFPSTKQRNMEFAQHLSFHVYTCLIADIKPVFWGRGARRQADTHG